MKIFLFLIPLFAFAGPECPRGCDLSELPSVPADLISIREKVTGECAQVEEIVVTPRNPEDPCSFDNIDTITSNYLPEEGQEVSWSASIDKNYTPGGTCAGRVLDNLCYIKSNNIYPQSGSHKWVRDHANDLLILDIKKSKNCSGESCAFPYERDRVSIGVPFDEIYDTQQRKNTVIECRPENCYSISLVSGSSRLTPGKKNLGHQVITVTRMPDGSIRTQLYINTAYTTVLSKDTKDGRLGEGGLHPELVGKAPDTFQSCSVPFAQRYP